MDHLTNKQRVFIEAYLETWNARDAARRAGYKHVYSQASRIRKRLQPWIEVEIKKRAMGADEVLARLADQARLNAADFLVRTERAIYQDGEYIRTEYAYEPNWDVIQAQGHLVKAVKNTAAGPVIEFHDAQKALELIGKKLGLWRDVTEFSGRDGGPIQIIEIVRDDSDPSTD